MNLKLRWTHQPTKDHPSKLKESPLEPRYHKSKSVRFNGLFLTCPMSNQRSAGCWGVGPHRDQMGMVSKEISVMLILTWHRGKSNGLNFDGAMFLDMGVKRTFLGTLPHICNSKVGHRSCIVFFWSLAASTEYPLVISIVTPRAMHMFPSAKSWHGVATCCATNPKAKYRQVHC